MKKVLLYTCAIDGLGDYYAAFKILLTLVTDKNLQLTWLIRSQQDSILQKIIEAKQQFPSVKIIHLIPQYPTVTGLPEILRQDRETEVTKSIQEIIPLLPIDTDLIIVLPNVNEMDCLQCSLQERCKKAKILNISEYDHLPTNQVSHSMGLGQKSLGVLVPEMTKIKEFKPIELQKLPGLNDFNVNAPFFFGYANNQVKGWNESQRKTFISSVLVIGEKEGHENFQIVTNIPQNIFYGNNRSFRESLANWVANIEYYSNDGTITSIDLSEDRWNLTSTKTLKIFNPFPLKTDQFQNLLYRSHKMTLCTGDQSLIETIFASKCIIYQVMKWKVGLMEAFVSMVKEICGTDSFYYNFVHDAIYHHDLTKFLEEKWNPALIPSLQNDIKKIAMHIQQNKNFDTVFPKLLASLIGTSAEEKVFAGELAEDCNAKHTEIFQKSKLDSSNISMKMAFLMFASVEILTHLIDKESNNFAETTNKSRNIFSVTRECP